MVLVEIIDNDEIEVGGCGHLAPAELAERQHDALLSLHPAIDAAEILLDGAVHRADQHIGKPGKRFAGLLRRYRAGEDARADQEHVLLSELARAIEQVFVGVGLRKRPGQLRRKPLGVGQRAEE